MRGKLQKNKPKLLKTKSIKRKSNINVYFLQKNRDEGDLTSEKKTVNFI